MQEKRGINIESICRQGENLEKIGRGLEKRTRRHEKFLEPEKLGDGLGAWFCICTSFDGLFLPRSSLEVF